METLLFHPKVVHLPVALAVLMPLVAGGLALAWWRDWLPRRAWLLAVTLQAALVGSGYLAMETGEREEERVEHVVAEHLVEAHAEAAGAFVWGGAVVLGLMLAAASLEARRGALGLAAASTLGAAVVLALAARAGERGGALVYEHGAAAAYVHTPAGAATAEAHGATDDDD